MKHTISISSSKALVLAKREAGEDMGSVDYEISSSLEYDDPTGEITTKIQRAITTILEEHGQ